MEATETKQTTKTKKTKKTKGQAQTKGGDALGRNAAMARWDVFMTLYESLDEFAAHYIHDNWPQASHLYPRPSSFSSSLPSSLSSLSSVLPSF